MSDVKVIGGGDLADALRKMAARSQEEDKPKRKPREHVALLAAACEELDQVYQFTPGQLVTWKASGQIMRTSGPFIFRAYLAPNEIRRFEDNPSSLFYNEMADCVIADLEDARHDDDTAVVVEWAASSRRLVPYELSDDGVN